MKFLLDIFPVVIFFVIFKIAGNNSEIAHEISNRYISNLVLDGEISNDQAPILLATLMAILATFIQILILALLKQKIETILWISLFLIIIFGGATIFFNDEYFIKLKPTVLYWCFASVLFFSHIFFKKNLIKFIMEKQLTLPEKLWNKLNYAWTFFFLCMGFINLYVAFTFPISFWVNFKLFGFLGLMIIFVVAQSLLIAPFLKDNK